MERQCLNASCINYVQPNFNIFPCLPCLSILSPTTLSYSQPQPINGGVGLSPQPTNLLQGQDPLTPASSNPDHILNDDTAYASVSNNLVALPCPACGTNTALPQLYAMPNPPNRTNQLEIHPPLAPASADRVYTHKRPAENSLRDNFINHMGPPAEKRTTSNRGQRCMSCYNRGPVSSLNSMGCAVG